MKGGKTGSQMLSLALCALIALLLFKLGLTILGLLHVAPADGVAVRSAMAKEERPQKKNSSPPAQTSTVSTFTPAVATGAKSMGALEKQADQIHRQQDKLREQQRQLEQLKKEVEQKISTLLALQKQLMLSQGQKQNAVNARVQGLAKIYGTMKPKQAAKLMGSLDDTLVKSIISTMPPDKAASILALMDVKKAAKISEDLSGQ
ncbi:MAG: MotE family protein [Syntrophobacteraceae bacterium]